MSAELRKLVLTPVGAAVVGRSEPEVKERCKRLTDGDDLMALRQGQVRGQRELEKEILDRLLALDLTSERGLQDTSPEIKSLVKIGIDATSRVILYASETGDGILSARMVREFVGRHWNCGVEMQVITGLQVQDAARFRSVGAQNYVRSVVTEVNDPNNRYGYQIILNATAGFKALVPYTTLIGLLFQVPVQYIFETSSALLTLPPLPVGFEETFVERVMPLLEQLDRETALPEEQLFRGLTAEERDRLLPLLEPVDGCYTLSPLGTIAYERYKAPPPLTPSQRQPRDKDHTRDYSQEPHRSAEFERFKQRLAECEWIDGFRYHKGADVAVTDVRQVGDHLHVTCGGIELTVETTATHPSHYHTIIEAIRGLLP